MIYRFYQWRIQGKARGSPPSEFNFFIFMQFSVKILPNNRFALPSLWLVLPMENPGSATVLRFTLVLPMENPGSATVYISNKILCMWSKNVISHFYSCHDRKFNVPTELHRIISSSFPFWLMLFSNFLREEIFQFSLLFSPSVLFIHNVKLFYYTFFACLHYQFTCIIPKPGVQRVNIHKSERIKHLISEINSHSLSGTINTRRQRGRQPL